MSYQELITSAYQNKLKFTATVNLDTSVQTRVQELLASMIPLFDVDVALGNQLDIIGQWVGVSRNISIPIPGVYFSWDSTIDLGWDYGTWRPINQPANITSLPDDQYRILIKTKIAANQWDGTTEGAYAIWSRIFTDYVILIQDHQNMTYSLIIIGGIVDSLTLALLVGGYVPLRPEGVLISSYLVPANAGPAFAWDTDNASLKGWDTGSWLREILVT